MGGLTVLKELAKLLPAENYVYVADQAHCPYGAQSPDRISARVQKITEYLLSRRVKAIVIACNTATVSIQAAQKLTAKPVVGVIRPACACAVKLTRVKKVTVLATELTVKSGIYQKILGQYGVESVALPCGELVDFIENYDLNDPLGTTLVTSLLSRVKDVGSDVVIHGCTHFPLLEDKMRKVLGNPHFVSCALPTAQCLQKILSRNGILACGESVKCALGETAQGENSPRSDGARGKIEIITTGNVERAEKSMRWFKLPHDPVIHLQIE